MMNMRSSVASASSPAGRSPASRTAVSYARMNAAPTQLSQNRAHGVSRSTSSGRRIVAAPIATAAAYP
jgi:hypothetical protein